MSWFCCLRSERSTVWCPGQREINKQEAVVIVCLCLKDLFCLFQFFFYLFRHFYFIFFWLLRFVKLKCNQLRPSPLIQVNRKWGGLLLGCIPSLCLTCWLSAGSHRWVTPAGPEYQPGKQFYLTCDLWANQTADHQTCSWRAGGGTIGMTGMKLRAAEAAGLHSSAGREVTMMTGKEKKTCHQNERKLCGNRSIHEQYSWSVLLNKFLPCFLHIKSVNNFHWNTDTVLIMCCSEAVTGDLGLCNVWCIYQIWCMYQNTFILNNMCSETATGSSDTPDRCVHLCQDAGMIWPSRVWVNNWTVELSGTFRWDMPHRQVEWVNGWILKAS